MKTLMFVSLLSFGLVSTPGFATPAAKKEASATQGHQHAPGEKCSCDHDCSKGCAHHGKDGKHHADCHCKACGCADNGQCKADAKDGKEASCSHEKHAAPTTAPAQSNSY